MFSTTKTKTYGGRIAIQEKHTKTWHTHIWTMDNVVTPSWRYPWLQPELQCSTLFSPDNLLRGPWNLPAIWTCPIPKWENSLRTEPGLKKKKQHVNQQMWWEKFNEYMDSCSLNKRANLFLSRDCHFPGLRWISCFLPGLQTSHGPYPAASWPGTRRCSFQMDRFGWTWKLKSIT
jgi:hypothetical protein